MKRTYNKRKRLTNTDSQDEDELDEMLNELGIPADTSVRLERTEIIEIPSTPSPKCSINSLSSSTDLIYNSLVDLTSPETKSTSSIGSLSQIPSIPHSSSIRNEEIEPEEIINALPGRPQGKRRSKGSEYIVLMDLSHSFAHINNKLCHELVNIIYEKKKIPVDVFICNEMETRLPKFACYCGINQVDTPLIPAKAAATIIYYKAIDFIEILQTAGVKEIYETVEKVKKYCTVKSKGSPQSRTMIIIEGLNKGLLQHRKRKKSTANYRHITYKDIEEITLELYIEARTQTTFTADTDETRSYITRFVRELYYTVSKPPLSMEHAHLENIPKLQSFRPTLYGSNQSQSYATTWLRMLQMISGVSEDKAHLILDAYPSFQSLWQEYQDPQIPLHQKERLIADTLCASGKRMDSAVSKRLYQVFTEEDPNANVQN